MPPRCSPRRSQRLERESRLVRRERRRDIDLYEITSEFLVPWITPAPRRGPPRARATLRRAAPRATSAPANAGGCVVLGSVAGRCCVVASVVAVLALWALHQRDIARHAGHARRRRCRSRRRRRRCSAPGPTSRCCSRWPHSRSPRAETRGSVMTALEAAAGSARSWGSCAATPTRSTHRLRGDGRMLASAGVDSSSGCGTRAPASRWARRWRTRPRVAASHSVRRRARWHPPARRDRPPVGRAHPPPARRRRCATPTGSSARRLQPRRPHACLRRRATARSGSGTSRTQRQLGAPLRGHDGSVDRRLQPGRAHARVRQPRRRRSGCGTRARTGSSASRCAGTASGVLRRRVQPRRPHARLRQRAMRRVRLWDVRTRRRLGAPLTRPRGYVYDVTFSADGRTLASAGADGTVRLWDVAHATRRSAPRCRPLRAVYGVGVQPRRAHARRRPASTTRSGSGTLRPRRPSARRSRGHADAVTHAVVSATGARSRIAGDDQTIRLLGRAHPPAARPPAIGPAGSSAFSVAFSRDGRTLASAADDRTVALLGRAPAAGRSARRSRVTLPRSRALAFSPDGRTLAPRPKTRRSALGRAPAPCDAARRSRATPATSTPCAFSPDGRTLASGRDGHDDPAVESAPPASGSGAPLSGHAGEVSSVAFSPDGRILASAGHDRTDPAVGRAHAPRGRRAAAGHTDSGQRRGVQPGRAHAGFRRR